MPRFIPARRTRCVEDAGIVWTGLGPNHPRWPSCSRAPASVAERHAVGRGRTTPRGGGGGARSGCGIQDGMVRCEAPRRRVGMPPPPAGAALRRVAAAAVPTAGARIRAGAALRLPSTRAAARRDGQRGEGAGTAARPRTCDVHERRYARRVPDRHARPGRPCTPRDSLRVCAGVLVTRRTRQCRVARGAGGARRAARPGRANNSASRRTDTDTWSRG